jgi:type I restriction enzyme S subunit
MREKIVTLEDVCDRGSSNLRQKDLENLTGDYPVYGASGYIKSIDFYHQENEYIAVIKDGAGIGRTVLMPEKSSVIGTLQYLIPNNSISTKYLYYAVTSMKLAKHFTGATIPHIYFKDYKKEKLPLPSLNKQLKIGNVLNKVEKIISNKKVQLEEYDTLIKSRFIEMFGDPLTNSKMWEVKPLSECLLSIDNGKSFVCDSKSRDDTQPAILKLSAVTYGQYRPYENKAILNKEMFVRKTEVMKGDLLFTRKNTPELVGMSAYVNSTPPKLMMPDLIFRLNTNSLCNKVYLWKLINLDRFRCKISELASGSAKSMSNISKERLRGLNIPVPPIESQNEFDEFVQYIDKLKVEVHKSLDETQKLFDSLMQEYFE